MQLFVTTEMHEGRAMYVDSDAAEIDTCGDSDVLRYIWNAPMKKVYCKCGCIVDLDGKYLDRRLMLGKDIECIHCRNVRISKEIDELNAHFNPEEAEAEF